MQQPDTKPQDQEFIGSHELREITELLIKHHGLHEGLYDLAFEFQIAVGGVGFQMAAGGIGPDPSSILPGAMFGVRRIGISKAVKVGISTVNAAEVNPRSAAKKIAAKKTTRK